jgi:hypothetical protein
VVLPVVLEELCTIIQVVLGLPRHVLYRPSQPFNVIALPTIILVMIHDLLDFVSVFLVPTKTY